MMAIVLRHLASLERLRFGHAILKSWSPCNAVSRIASRQTRSPALQNSSLDSVIKIEINKKKGLIVSESQASSSTAMTLGPAADKHHSPDPRSSSIHLSPSRGSSQTNTAILMSATERGPSSPFPSRQRFRSAWAASHWINAMRA